MNAIRSADLKMIKQGGYQQFVFVPGTAIHGGLCHLGEDVNLDMIRIRCADFDSNIFCRFLVDSKPDSGI